MAQTSILSAITLPAVTTLSATRCLQWSADGQVILLARTSIYILTPQLGVNIESSSLIKQSLDKGIMSDSRPPVLWLRTMIEWNKDSGLWPADCQDWGAVSLGSLDPHFRAVTCSPSNLTADAGCVIAVLNSNMEVSLWAAVKNRLVGVWSKVGYYDGSENVLTPPNDTDAGLYRTLQAQVTSIAWSTQADFAASLDHNIDASFLAIGSRAGTVCLAKYSEESDFKNCLRHIALFPVGDRWVTHLSWSAWATSQSRQSQAFLACAISDGSINVVKVTQSLREVSEHTGFIKEYESSVACEVLNDKACEATNIGITSLEWIQTAKPDPFLVFSSPGQLHIWSSALSGGAWNGSRVITLRAVHTCVGSSSLATVSGISYVRRHDVLVVSLVDGSFHAISQFSSDPILAPTSSDIGISTEALSATSRSVFLKVEKNRPQRTDVNRIGGMIPFDDASVCAWIHEAARPTDFDYKHDAKHSSTFVIAQMWEESADGELLDTLTRIAGSKPAAGHAPVALLRSSLLHLQRPGRLSRLHIQISQLLRNSTAVVSDNRTLNAWSGEFDAHFRSAFRRSLDASLFGSDGLLSQRMCASIAMFCQNQAADTAVQQQFDGLSARMLIAIRTQILRTLIRHATACSKHLSNTEIPFVLRIVSQALLLGTPADLGLEARELSAKVNVVIPGDCDPSTLGPDELCPACHASVFFQNAASAICANGHTWARCSITSFLLTTPMVRTCIGCGRKALLPPPRDASGAHWLPAYARSWIVEDLLDAVRRCLFCGNNFVTLI